jgi:hypothetical protein
MTTPPLHPLHPLHPIAAAALPTEPYRSAPPDAVLTATCDLCGCDCLIRRGVIGPQSFGGAMARQATLHDHIRCPHADSTWHRHARALLTALHSQPSPSLAALIHQDLQDLLSQSLPAQTP